MKTLRKVSFENFERLTIVEASQLYGGTGGNPPTTPLPTDSIPPNRNDSIPPTTPPKYSVNAGVNFEPNNSVTVKGGCTVTFNSGTTIGVTGGWNSKTGGQGGLVITQTFGGKKK